MSALLGVLFFIVVAIAIGLAGYFGLLNFTLVSENYNYDQVNCDYCQDENGKSQGWLELFNWAEDQGKTGYLPATRINGNVIACPKCGGQKMISQSSVPQDY
jgi:DNA-directed RNA polymerase subunit RPC12/RpoP